MHPALATIQSGIRVLTELQASLAADAAPDTRALSRALCAEGVTFSAYCLMHCLEAGPAPLVTLAGTTGQSYWSIRHQITRTRWFSATRDSSYPGGRVALSLSPDGAEKLARITRRLLP